jgi:RNA-directed DNA polymerase
VTAYLVGIKDASPVNKRRPLTSLWANRRSKRIRVVLQQSWNNQNVRLLRSGQPWTAVNGHCCAPVHNDGFDFLGFNVRKYAGKLLIKPSKGAIKSFLERIRGIIKANVATKTEDLIRQLNSKLRGWTNYFRHVVAKKSFTYVDDQLFRALITWIKRRHPNKSARWKRQRYFRSEGRRNWVFFASTRDASGKATCLDLFQATSVPIIRHIKIQAQATPYDPAFTDYFARRAQSRRVSRLRWRGMVVST